MTHANGIAESLERIKQLQKLHMGGVHPSIETFRQIWHAGNQRGKIVILEGAQEDEAGDIRVGMIVSTDDMQMIRVALTKQETINLSRALIESVS